jgi:hypothetical protein
VCRVSFRPRRAEQRVCGADCRRVHRKRTARRRRRRDLEHARAVDRERQARHRERDRERRAVERAVNVSRARSDLEAVEMVQEIQKKLAGLERCVARMSRARSTPQRTDHVEECGEFRG